MSITIIIVLITGFISYQGFNNRSFFDSFKHSPYIENQAGEYYRMLSSGFLHGSWTHLIINLYVLYEFGSFVENAFIAKYGQMAGSLVYLLFYLSALIAADIPTFNKQKDNPSFSSIGASGAVSSILFVYIFFQPWAVLLIYFILPMPAILAGIAYLIYTTWAAKNSNDNIDHSAHFSGAIYGLIMSGLLFHQRIPGFFQDIIGIF